MQAWSNVDVPQLQGAGFRPAIFDSVTKERLIVGPESGEARLYSCGITPYDATHLGHAFTYVSIDLLQRVWLDAGLRVHHAQNITDVDDPLLERANATGSDWRELATSQIELFRTDMTALRVLPPQTYAGVVESIDQVVALIARLREVGAVYQVPGEYPDWYFAVESAPELLQGDLGEKLALFAERGGDPARPGKRHPLDPLVWRAERLGEPTWDSLLGPGRPGWHVECTAIALQALGANFDVQAGGVDLAFPHHPMCAAQAKVLTKELFASAFLHVGMVGLDGEKMSKSKGNLVFVHKLLAEDVDPMAIRLLLLSHHYRSDWEYFRAELNAATERLTQWRTAVTGPGIPAQDVIEEIRVALADDLDAPTALAAVDRWARTPGTDSGAGLLLAGAIDALLGVELR